MDILEKLNRDLSPEAKYFLVKYTEYVHLIDDLCDGDVPTTPQNILKLTAMSVEVHAHPFFVKYSQALGSIDIMVNILFQDTVQWEKSEEPWKKNAADVLRHRAYDMAVMVIYLEKGYEYATEISGPFREHTHLQHLNDIIRYSEVVEKPA